MAASANPQRGRHRGAHRDPLGTAFTVLWGLGHVVTLALLGIVAQHQLDAEHQFAAPPARVLPDREPTV
ncbi:hypothetical protein [Saccharothrix sp. ST-888]|uniref:hypothetical protein n=1 Tax=Saccharothrix sp. ST-888 TaxID=1427391 RepID=UPI0005ED1903|nr:hypothetical protein [Saccharothrix sp. ST-888]KJK56032.1 hypothetical protein UK12_25165 [Saccharothrix sp. ST-888]